ncbi:MAG: glycosyltransferase [Bacteroidales bacterium]|nr:glycosyltransferase [Bacteroidales bacterium]
MLFSIIIPVYNVEKYLRECLDSVLAQTFEDWEAICIDDGSTDRSAAILEEYAQKEARVKVISQPNGGLSAARNTGLKAANGEYVLFLDSDDWLEPNALDVLASKLDGEDMLCFSGRRYFENEHAYHEPDRLKSREYGSGMDYYNDNALAHRDFAFICVVLRAYRRSFLLDNGLLFKEGIFHEDDLFTPEACFFARRVKVLDECLYDYRVRANSITTTATPKRLSDLMETSNELAAFFLTKTGFDKTVVYRAITHHYQRAFVDSTPAERAGLKHLCDWRLYRKVSRTKPRHRINYLKNKYL